MATTKRTSSKQKLDTVLKGFEGIIDSQTKHNKQINDLIKEMSALNKKMDSMIDLLKKAGEIEVDLEKRQPTQAKEDKEISFSDL